MTENEPPQPPVFDCRQRRHKVITADGICVLCGARGVVDARRLAPATPPANLAPLALTTDALAASPEET